MQSIPLWSDAAPFARGSASHDIPTLDVYEPFGTRFNGMAALIFPGGGYGFLSAQEGEGFAGMLQLWGFKSFVCNYRLGTNGYRHPTMITDASRAIRTLRARAEEFQIDPERIVVIGSSAGGHLAATLLTKWDEGNPDHPDPIERMSSRPNLGVLCYPVISMLAGAHVGSRANLLGPDSTPEQESELSAHLHVRADTPPCFVWHTVEDQSVAVRHALLFVDALEQARVPFEFHCYERGIHGLGMKDESPWVQDCYRWLQLHFARPEA